MKVITLKIGCRNDDAVVITKVLTNVVSGLPAVTNNMAVAEPSRDDLRRIHFDLPTEKIQELKDENEL